jgi:hypothetical protein
VYDPDDKYVWLCGKSPVVVSESPQLHEMLVTEAPELPGAAPPLISTLRPLTQAVERFTLPDAPVAWIGEVATRNAIPSATEAVLSLARFGPGPLEQADRSLGERLLRYILPPDRQPGLQFCHLQ